MAGKTIDLEVIARETGKHNSRELRRKELIPAIVYGSDIDNPTPVAAVEKFIRKYNTMKYENALFTLKCKDSPVNDVQVLVKEVRIHPLSRRPVHVDFYAVDLTKAVRVTVEIRFEGKAKGVTEEGGILQPLARQLEVECLPNAIPDHFPLDISEMNIGDTLRLSEITIPDGVKVLTTEDIGIVTVIMPKEEEEPEVEAAAEGEEGAEGEGAEGEGAAEGAEGEAKKEDSKEEKKD